jgi:hypothetical protein
MKRLGLILVLIVAAGAVWAAWTCYGTEGTVRDIASRLPSEESLDTMSLEQSTEQIKLAMVTCARVASLEANPLARLLRGDEIKALAERCERRARTPSEGLEYQSSSADLIGTPCHRRALPRNFPTLRRPIPLISLRFEHFKRCKGPKCPPATASSRRSATPR